MAKQAIVGLVAHVDAGKTTLAEAMLFNAGAIRSMGRVDKADSHLDTHAIEKTRGITIFTGQAHFIWKNLHVDVLDAPGHVDFSAEAERTIRALDYAILVIDGNDGVQTHTLTMWRLLERYHVPCFIFFNKMDLAVNGRDELLLQVVDRFGNGCFDAARLNAPEIQEELASIDERAIEEFLTQEVLSVSTLKRLVAERKAHPCYFGSALKNEGIAELLDGLVCYVAESPDCRRAGGVAGFVYRVNRDARGNRLCHIKLTSGTLRPKQLVKGFSKRGVWEEKVDQIRLYSGDRFEAISEVAAGRVCAVTGFSVAGIGDVLGDVFGNAFGDAPGGGFGYAFGNASGDVPGGGFGNASGNAPGGGFGNAFGDARAMMPMQQFSAITPVMAYSVSPGNHDVHTVYAALSELAEEDPMLGLAWDERLQEIRVMIMGRIQLEVLQQTMAERFGLTVGFGAGGVLYKETIAAPVRGVGHFEPLRHYAEVQLIIEPGKRGSGVVFGTRANLDDLDLNWQRLILTNAMEREHVGVLVGAPLTDVRITLLGGRAHAKHTEGGDFRQATYRAIRQGLMSAQSVLLEPWYHFELEIPAERVGRALGDLHRMGARFNPPDTSGMAARLAGEVPASEVGDYAAEVAGYTSGAGSLLLEFGGYAPCHNADKIIADRAYNPEADLPNTPDSVFCSHGAGFTVKWGEVPSHAHVSIDESRLRPWRAADSSFFANGHTAF